MSDSTLIKKLQRISDDLKTVGRTDDVIVNAMKHELQYYILDFVYNHPKYAALVMYGGSLLRIVYDLPRMSEDLDFQTNVDFDLEELKQAFIKHFQDRHNLAITVLVKPRPERNTKLIIINFDILQHFHLRNIKWTTLKIRFDINVFEKGNDFVKESLPIVHEGLTFSILTYPLSTLMASKITAVLQRTQRGIGHGMAGCKPRDIYDLIWYLDRKATPDMEYLQAKGEHYETLYDLFYGTHGLKFRVGNLSDDLFEKDLAQFFFDQSDLDEWLRNWRKKFETAIARYSIYKVNQLETIGFVIDFSTETRVINYFFTTDQANKNIQFTVQLSEYWFIFDDMKLGQGHRQNEIESKVQSAKPLTDLDYEYVGLFYRKIKEFLLRNKQVMLNDRFVTKVIRTNADNLQPKSQVYLDKRILEHIQFEELM